MKVEWSGWNDGCLRSFAPLIIQFHSSFHLVSWNECEMDWFRWLHSLRGLFFTRIKFHLIAVNSWLLAPIRFINIHWVEWNERIQGTFNWSPSIRYTHSSIPCGHSPSLPFNPLSFQLIHWMKCGLNWSESGPVPLRFINYTHSITFSFV